MMENHAYNQILNNPNAPFIDKFAKQNNLATNYFAIAYPSLTNYLETVGGSNFGVHADNFPNWHSETPCSPNLTTGFEPTVFPRPLRFVPSKAPAQMRPLWLSIAPTNLRALRVAPPEI
jgi:hypothetical protein